MFRSTLLFTTGVLQDLQDNLAELLDPISHTRLQVSSAMNLVLHQDIWMSDWNSHLKRQPPLWLTFASVAV